MFPYTDFIRQSCEKLEQQGAVASDKHLKYIVQLQRLLEEMDNFTDTIASSSSDERQARLISIGDQMDHFKSSISFALGSCRRSTSL